jgi:hypothetical protein
VGTITDFDRGNRGKRYVGFGMGVARVFVTIQYLDRNGGQIIFEDKVVGTLSGGVFGGDTKRVLQELAKSVAANTKLMLLRSVSVPNNVSATVSATAGEAPKDRQVLPIKSNDLSGAQQRMNELATAGYRLVDFRIAGNNRAQATMEKSPVAPVARPNSKCTSKIVMKRVSRHEMG